MCGLSGFLDLSGQAGNVELRATIARMSNALLHRGPDDSGEWGDATEGIALGHRRLSIVDLSPEGHQPMHSACGRYVISFNGEIYNYQEIRRELEAEMQAISGKWRGHSDTEVMLEAIRWWGIERAVKRFNGMFAFALWDRQDRLLYLVRDRLGEKPLYYGWVGRTFLFGSELKALRAHPALKGEINRNALALYLRHNCIPAPYSIYEGIFKLSPATILTVSRSTFPSVSLLPYWSAREIAERGVAHPFTGSDQEAVAQLDALLRDAIKLEMVADVPLGAFLSGGVDSSTVVALMQAQSARPVKTFTIGFNEAGYNEAVYAKAVARHLGTDHTELYITPEQAMAVIPKLPTLYDEPFSDSSQIPTYLVSELARRHVTVSLSGDGGDELFAGYNRYFLGRDIWNKIGWIPPRFRNKMAQVLTAVSPQAWDRAFNLFPFKTKHRAPGDKLHKLAEIFGAVSPEVMYTGLVSHWKKPTSIVLGASEPPTHLTNRRQWADFSDFTLQMMYLDTVTYLPDDILVKVDRASMGVSLEGRVPFLDPRIVEFAWQVPLSMKVRGGKGKWLLRQVLHQYVPRELIERPKVGFGIPIDTWLRGPLREWGESLLDERRLKIAGFFKAELIREKWVEHLSGTRNWHYYLWDILMFQAWLECNK